VLVLVTSTLEQGQLTCSVSRLNSEDLPTLGSPTMPILSEFLTLPKREAPFCDGSSFLGGIAGVIRARDRALSARRQSSSRGSTISAMNPLRSEPLRVSAFGLSAGAAVIDGLGRGGAGFQHCATVVGAPTAAEEEKPHPLTPRAHPSVQQEQQREQISPPPARPGPAVVSHPASALAAAGPARLPPP
jgi:hypothetical protein